MDVLQFTLKKLRKTICERTWLRGSGRLAIKINITLFVGNEDLNIFQLTIFFEKKTIFSKITAKNNFLGHDHFVGNGAPNYKNEYNLFHGKWGIKYSFEDFSSKKPIRAEWKPKNWFWGHIFLHVSGSIGPIVSKFNRIQPFVDSRESREFHKNWFKIVTYIVTVIMISWKSKSVIFECKLKIIYEVLLLESILNRKKILWRINFVLIKFSQNALLFQKSRN